jgi:hypothetical protein
VTAFELENGRVRTVQAIENNKPLEIAATWVVAAMPVEIMSTPVMPAMKAAAPSLAHLDRLQTRCMK